MHRSSRRAVLALASGALFLLAAVLVDFVGDLQLSGVYATAAIIASISGRPRSTAVIAGAAVTAALASGFWHGTVGEGAWSIRLLSCVVAGTAAVVAAGLGQRYRRQVRHTSRLAQDLMDALAVELTGARTVTEVADGFLGQAVERLGAASAMVFVLGDDDVLRSVAWVGRGGPQADQYAEFPLDADLPGAAAVRSRTPLHFSGRAAILAAFPALSGYYPQERSLHVLPLVHDGRSTGLLALTFPPRVVETDDEQGLLVSLANALSAALVRAQELAAADAEAQRAALLSEASRTLSRSLDRDETLAEVSRLLVPQLSDWCSLHLLRDGTLETAAVWHRDPETSAWAQDMRDVFPVDMSAPTGAPAVVRSGQPELYPSIPAELVEASAVNEEHATLLKRLGLVSAMVAPMRNGETIIGALSVAYAESGRHYAEQDTHLLVDLASRIGTAIGNAESFARQARRLTEVTKVAAAAQQAILASPPPQIGPLTLSARYVSAAEEAQIGGDLYEVVAAADRVRVLIGDVRGKGLGAVRTATIVLGGFRSVAVQDVSIEEVARQLDAHVQVYLHDEEDFVTAALVDLFHDGRFALALCGHPAPLLTHEGGWRLLTAAPTVPLGLGSTPTATQGSMAPGDRMVLFTDGLLEARKPDGAFLDPEPLWSLAASQPFPTVLDSMLDALRFWTEGRLQDDLALLSIQFRDPASARDGVVDVGSTRSLSGQPPMHRLARILPAEGASVGEARRMVRTILEGTTLEAVVDDAQLAVSEIVTNALVHAGGEVHLTLVTTQAGLRVEVGDGSTHLPVYREYAAASATGRGLHMVDSVVTRWSSFRLGSGKVVWFEIEDPLGEPFATYQPPQDPAQVGRNDVVEIELRNVPLLMHAAWQEHASALLREYLLTRLDEDLAFLGSHAQASDAMNVLYEQIPAPDVGGAADAVMANALEPHVSAAALTLRVPRGSVPHFAALDEMITEALHLAADGSLLVPPTQPEIREMSRWLCQEVVDQARSGRAPLPWSAPDPLQVLDPTALVVDGWDPSEVSGSSRAVLATNEAGLVVAVSPPVVRHLGFGSAEELVGRPIITIVPDRYHQAHVAGTTLHVVNGRDPLLGVRITVPVVHADGQEHPVELMVVSRPLSTGRRLFVAEFFLAGVTPETTD